MVKGDASMEDGVVFNDLGLSKFFLFGPRLFEVRGEEDIKCGDEAIRRLDGAKGLSLLQKRKDTWLKF